MIFAIAMDYTVFLLATAKEHYERSGDPHAAQIDGLAYSGRIIFVAAAVVFFAYTGFEAVANLGEEARRPERDMPRALIGTLLACTLLYVLVAVEVLEEPHRHERDEPAERRRGDLAPAGRETGDLGAVRRQGEGAADADEPRAAAGPHQGIGGIAVLQQIVDVRDIAGHHAQPGGAGGGSVHSTQPNPAGRAADAAA